MGVASLLFMKAARSTGILASEIGLRVHTLENNGGQKIETIEDYLWASALKRSRMLHVYVDFFIWLLTRWRLFLFSSPISSTIAYPTGHREFISVCNCKHLSQTSWHSPLTPPRGGVFMIFYISRIVAGGFVDRCKPPQTPPKNPQKPIQTPQGPPSVCI